MDYTATADYTAVPPSVMGPIMIAYMVVVLLLAVLYVVSTWKIFVKAGKPGWAAIVPIYNFVVLLEIIKRPTWWIVLLFVPVVNAAIGIVFALDLAKVFGKSTVFGLVLLWAFGFVGYPMLAFGSAKYTGGTTPPATPGAMPPQTPAPVQSVPPAVESIPQAPTQ